MSKFSLNLIVEFSYSFWLSNQVALHANFCFSNELCWTVNSVMNLNLNLNLNLDLNLMSENSHLITQSKLIFTTRVTLLLFALKLCSCAKCVNGFAFCMEEFRLCTNCVIEKLLHNRMFYIKCIFDMFTIMITNNYDLKYSYSLSELFISL